MMRQREFERFRAERIALSAEDVLRRLDVAPLQTRVLLKSGGIIGAHLYQGAPRAPGRQTDRVLETALGKAIAAGAGRPTGFRGRFEDCFGPFTAELKNKFSQRAAGFVADPSGMLDRPGADPESGPFTTIAFDLPALRVQRSATLNPIYLPAHRDRRGNPVHHRVPACIGVAR